jgi:pilus assembly protein CpaF
MIEEIGTSFVSEDHLRRTIEKIVARVGRRIDEAQPMVDARLPDGSRVNAVIAPVALDGSMLTVRKFPADPFTDEDLIAFGTMTPQVRDLLVACVEGKRNIIISGGTGAGKTTFLNVMSGFIPSGERIVTIEDAAELQLHKKHVLRMEARPPNIEGRGVISIRDLVRNALRMRPDRIVVGEVRDGAALDMLQAMNTGHEGSLTTVHANSPRDSLSRVETMVLMADVDLPVRVIRDQIASAIDLVVQLARLKDGTRRVVSITEVAGMEGEVITMQDVFAFDYGAGRDERGRYLGELRFTGLRPKFFADLADLGVSVPTLAFGQDRVTAKGRP